MDAQRFMAMPHPSAVMPISVRSRALDGKPAAFLFTLVCGMVAAADRALHLVVGLTETDQFHPEAEPRIWPLALEKRPMLRIASEL